MTDNLGKKILDTIKEKKISPKPKWSFLLKDSLLWGIGVAALLIGGLSFAVILHLVINNDWDVYSQIHDSLLGFILLTLPYFWFVLLGLFVFAAYYNVRHTKKGYKYSVTTMIIGGIGLSIALGVFWHSAGVGATMERLFADRLPLYYDYTHSRHRTWTQPREGLLGGVIIEIEGSVVLLRDLSGHEWTVETNHAYVSSETIIDTDMRVRMFGKIIGTNIFIAEKILPWNPRTWRGHEDIRYFLLEPGERKILAPRITK